MTDVERHIEDAEVILAQLEYFAVGTREELIERQKREGFFALAELPHPNGRGGFTIGREGHKRLCCICNRFLSANPSKAVNVSSDTYFKAVGREFTRIFLAERRSIEETTIIELLESAYNKSQEKFEAVTHYIPCSFFFEAEPVEFYVGPVHFLHNSRFGTLHDAEIENLRHDGSDAKFSSTLVDDLKSFFAPYNWVAELTVGPCDSSVSYERANSAVDAGLNVLKLLLSEKHSEDIRSGHSPVGPATRSFLRRREGKLEISVARHWGPRGKNWFRAITTPNDYHLRTAGRTLQAIVEPSRRSFLGERFLDALWWYGQGVSELSAAKRIGYYVTAMERIVGGGRSQPSETAKKRAAILCSDESRSFAHWQREFNAIYNIRYELFHGTLSPFQESVPPGAVKAENAARWLLLNGLRLYDQLGLDDRSFNEKKLYEFYRNTLDARH